MHALLLFAPTVRDFESDLAACRSMAGFLAFCFGLTHLPGTGQWHVELDSKIQLRGQLRLRPLMGSHYHIPFFHFDCLWRSKTITSSITDTFANVNALIFCPTHATMIPFFSVKSQKFDKIDN